MRGLERRAPAGSELPVLITPLRAGESLLESFPRLQHELGECLSAVGGVLLRGFDVPSVEAFQRFAAAFGHPLLNYEFGSTPRTAVASGIYTSTEYPAHQSIPLHNEQSYTREWPMKIWFHCLAAATSGGETPLADSRAVYRRVPASIRHRFADGLMYVRNYGDFDVPWQQVFNTDRPDEVEAFCRRAGIEWEWRENGTTLRTRQRCQSVARHPVTKEAVWFNQAHLFHLSNLPVEARESLEFLLGVDNVPRNVYFADGSPIDEAMLEEIRAVLAAETVTFPWQNGDVLMLDNMLIAHGRKPFQGTRKVVVAMAEPYAGDGKFSADK